MGVFSVYLIPLLYLYFAWRFLKKPAPYLDREGFVTKRARESQEIWDYVQRTAGQYCFFAALGLALLVYLMAENLDEGQNGLNWVRLGVEFASIALMVPVVNFLTNRKFPRT